MFFEGNREEFREAFFSVFQKIKANTPLSPLEADIASVIEQHPEYHQFLSDPKFLNDNFDPEIHAVNPFLHLSIHVALKEQITTDRPKGILALFKKHLHKSQDPHETEHAFMMCFIENLWAFHENPGSFDEKIYLEALKKL